MNVSMFDLTIPPMKRGFAVLANYIVKAQEHAHKHDLEPTLLVNARLAPDMLSFAGQVQRASDNAKGAIERLTGLKAPSFPDTETTFEDLQQRIADTVAWLNTITAEQLAQSAARSVELGFRSVSGVFSGDHYLTMILMPNFYFHIATAHGILRHNGVEIGKKDYLGNAG